MDAIEEPPKFATIRHAAIRLGVPVAWLKAEATAGRIPALRAGRIMLLEIDVVREVLRRRASENQSQEVAAGV